MTFLLFAVLLLINLGAGCYFTLANPLKVSEETSTKLTFIIRPKVFLGVGIFFSQLFVLFLFACVYCIYTYYTTCLQSLSKQYIYFKY